MIVEIRSTLGDFTFDTDAPPSTGGDLALRALRPTVILRPSPETSPYWTWAPKGEPASHWLAYLLAAGLVSLLFLAVRSFE